MLTIRKIREDDAEKLYSFFLTISEENRYFFAPHAFDRKTAEYITGEELNNSDIQRYVAVIDENCQELIVGYLFYWDWNKEVPSIGIAVSDNYHGRGYGNEMFSFLVDEAVRNSKRGLLLTVRRNNSKAISMYKKYGFVIIEELEDNLYKMEKKFVYEQHIIIE